MPITRPQTRPALPDWVTDAACAGADTRLFYPPMCITRPRLAERFGPIGVISYRLTRAAIDICATCPVQADCLAYALRTGEDDGIWGGTTPKQRRRMRHAHRSLS